MTVVVHDRFWLAWRFAHCFLHERSTCNAVYYRDILLLKVKLVYWKIRNQPILEVIDLQITPGPLLHLSYSKNWRQQGGHHLITFLITLTCHPVIFISLSYSKKRGKPKIWCLRGSGGLRVQFSTDARSLRLQWLYQKASDTPEKVHFQSRRLNWKIGMYLVLFYTK